MSSKTSKEIKDMKAVPYALVVGSLMYAMLVYETGYLFYRGHG